MARSKHGLTGIYNATPLTLNDEEGAAIAIDATGRVIVAPNVSVTPMPSGATALTGASGNVANAAAVGTLTSAASRLAYITGFEITGAGATAGAVVSVTVTGTIGGTLTYTYTAATGATVTNEPLVVPFTTPIPASAVNTNIVVTCPALGIGNTNNTAVAHGYLI